MEYAKALSFIHQGVSKSILHRLMGATTSTAAWEIMKKQFGGYDTVISIKIQNLWREFIECITNSLVTKRLDN